MAERNHRDVGRNVQGGVRLGTYPQQQCQQLCNHTRHLLQEPHAHHVHSDFLWLKKTKAQAAGLHRLGVGTPHSGFSPFSLVVAVGRTTRYEPKRGSFLTQWTCADDAKWLQLRTGGRWWASPVWSATQDPVPHSVLPPMPSSPSLPVFIDIGLSSQASLHTGPSSAGTSPVASA